jgi:hypothetical protein
VIASGKERPYEARVGDLGQFGPVAFVAPLSKSLNSLPELLACKLAGQVHAIEGAQVLLFWLGLLCECPHLQSSGGY